MMCHRLKRKKSTFKITYQNTTAFVKQQQILMICLNYQFIGCNSMGEMFHSLTLDQFWFAIVNTIKKVYRMQYILDWT